MGSEELPHDPDGSCGSPDTSIDRETTREYPFTAARGRRYDIAGCYSGALA